MEGVPRPGGGDRVRVTADNLRVDAASAEVFRALDRAQIPHILLKGPSIARWLYDPEEPRGYSDSDVLVRRSDVDAAERALAALGFERRYETDGLPDWWADHAHEWWRADDSVWVDLHHALQGVGVDDDAAWRVLSAGTERMDVARYPARVLVQPLRALNVALHAAHHGERWGKAIPDLERAVARVDRRTWQEAVRFAHDLDATDALGAGLRLTPDGATLAEQLGLPVNRSVDAALRVGAAPSEALGFERLAAAGLAGRLAIVARKVVPPPGFIKHWYPAAAHSRRRLIYAYLYRPIWLLRQAPPAWRAWREARRSVRGS